MRTSEVDDVMGTQTRNRCCSNGGLSDVCSCVSRTEIGGKVVCGGGYKAVLGSWWCNRLIVAQRL
jgi:hypothetical protein